MRTFLDGPKIYEFGKETVSILINKYKLSEIVARQTVDAMDIDDLMSLDFTLTEAAAEEMSYWTD